MQTASAGDRLVKYLTCTFDVQGVDLEPTGCCLVDKVAQRYLLPARKPH